MRIDVHQHVWTEPLLERLVARRSPPHVRWSGPRAVLHAQGEPPYELAFAPEAAERRSALVMHDGLDLAVVALSSPIGVEALARRDADELIDAYLTGVETLGGRFACWGPIALDRADPMDVDAVLARGCIGVSVPAGALSEAGRVTRLAPVLARISEYGVPLFVHPGPGIGERLSDPPLTGAPWWPAMTRYVAEMHTAWLSFVAFARPAHPRLTVVFAMLAGGAPLLAERLATRGGPPVDLRDPLVFYDSSSFGEAAVDAMARLVGEAQLVYGSDRPVGEPVPTGRDLVLQTNAERLLVAAGAAV